MNHFGFLKAQFPSVYSEAVKAERLALIDPRTSCFYGRRVVETLVKWAFAHDRSLTQPYDTNLSSLLHEPSFQALMGDRVFKLGKEVIRHGNRAAHDAGPINPHDSVASVSALFQFSYWFARTYGTTKPEPGLRFDPSTLPQLPKAGAPPKPAATPIGTVASTAAPEPPAEPPLTLAQVQELEAKLAASEAAREAQRKETEEELARLQAEVAAAKAAAEATPDTHDYSEAETRRYLIDGLLKEAGWHLTEERDREYPVSGMPDGKKGFADYVLWGDDGLPLAVIEAKRTTKDAKVGMQQARLYADCLEAEFGRRPLIYGTNGYQHWLWDDRMYPSRSVQGFHTKDELELLIQRRSTRGSLATTPIDNTIVERKYQERAIRRIAEHFEVDNRRKALLVMATGTGKTRTAIALSDVLLRANWAKRILFLADRRALVKQASRAFATFLPDVAPVNLLEDRNGEGRIYMSTHATMLNLINEGMGKQHRFGVGHFDLVIIDEAHRSVFRKYQAIFDHFDSLLVGLTATPREEIDRNTYDLFDLQPGVPTDAYPLAEAVADGYLVPPRAVTVTTRLLDRGLRYDDLSPEERDEWESKGLAEEADDDGHIESAAMNRWLFNTDTVDKVIANLMTKGIHVAGGDRLGKTIIFAANQRHADFIAQRFDVQYPELKGSFARIITHRTEHADSLIDEFSIADGEPHIAISVDMLDTGIDVPEVVNLVFFKPVRSKIKFWQMLGRGTRLCEDLFGPGDDKTEFLVFDHCGNFEFFNQDPITTGGSTTEALGTRLFKRRLDLIAALASDGTNPALRDDVADILWEGVAAINLDNVVVRPHLQVAERFQSKDAWANLSLEDLHALAAEVADLPTALPAEHEQAKRFDLLVVRLQLALLKQDPSFPALRDQVRVVASALEELAAIPTVKAQLPLIEDLQTEEWWEDVTLDLLEEVRRKLRMLVTLLSKVQRGALYVSFEDDLGEATTVAVPGLVPGTGFEQFRKKARAFLRSHTNELVIEKIHRGRPITPTDLAELEAILIAEGVATESDLAKGAAEAGSLGLFLRSLVGLDRAAAKELFNDFLTDGTATSTQIEFVNLIIDDLTEHGTVDPERIYESPYKDLAPTGPEAIFPEPAVDRIVATLDEVRRSAEGSHVA